VEPTTHPEQPLGGADWVLTDAAPVTQHRGSGLKSTTRSIPRGLSPRACSGGVLHQKLNNLTA